MEKEIILMGDSDWTNSSLVDKQKCFHGMSQDLDGDHGVVAGVKLLGL